MLLLLMIMTHKVTPTAHLHWVKNRKYFVSLYNSIHAYSSCRLEILAYIHS